MSWRTLGLLVEVHADDPELNRDVAYAKAGSALDEWITEPAGSFSHYELIGRDREGEDHDTLTTPVPAISSEGMRFIGELWQETYKANYKAALNLKDAVDGMSAGDIVNNKDDVRFLALTVGEFTSRNIRLYYDTGVCIRTEDQFLQFLESEVDYWVVPVSAHV